ncbi:Protein MODIFIER OF SNC1 11 [Zea mays]|uniref:Protein MODIFIER OF SNC1 11 n=1 Tax=Zea mays TaxID=4577 RepID=A0A1D6JYN4_MAIZE|nr:Protein MODIFIER OF SNC1 11 [Zea mays]
MRKLRKRPVWNDLVRAQMSTRRKKKKERPELPDLQKRLVDQQLGKTAKTARSRTQPLLPAQLDLSTLPWTRSQKYYLLGDFGEAIAFVHH